MNDREEFEKLRKRLYALADRMGMKLVIIVRRKNPFVPTDSAKNAVPPFAQDAQGKREPGDE